MDSTFFLSCCVYGETPKAPRLSTIAAVSIKAFLRNGDDENTQNQVSIKCVAHTSSIGIRFEASASFAVDKQRPAMNGKRLIAVGGELPAFSDGPTVVDGSLMATHSKRASLSEPITDPREGSRKRHPNIQLSPRCADHFDV